MGGGGGGADKNGAAAAMELAAGAKAATALGCEPAAVATPGCRLTTLSSGSLDPCSLFVGARKLFSGF